jgi:hypothetical protein
VSFPRGIKRPGLRMVGALPPLPHISSCRVQGPLHLFTPTTPSNVARPIFCSPCAMFCHSRCVDNDAVSLDTAILYLFARTETNNKKTETVIYAHTIRHGYFQKLFLSSGVPKGGFGVFNPPPPEIPKFWQSPTGLQIQRKMFSVSIPTS